jgi:hypothetical protein
MGEPLRRTGYSGTSNQNPTTLKEGVIALQSRADPLGKSSPAFVIPSEVEEPPRWRLGIAGVGGWASYFCGQRWCGASAHTGGAELAPLSATFDARILARSPI